MHNSPCNYQDQLILQQAGATGLLSCCAGFTFPGCSGNLPATATITPATATGPITLGLSGGMLGDKNGTIGMVRAPQNSCSYKCTPN